VDFPYLAESVIDAEAAELLHAVFGGPWRDHSPVDLDAIIYDHLSPRDNLAFNDEADLPMERGEMVLGKTLPIRGKILLNRMLKYDSEPGRSRFTLAHELGHWVLHRKLFLARKEELDLFAGGRGVDEDFEFVGLKRSVFPASCKPSATAREEWQANRFAVALLIDPVVLREEFARRFSTTAIARSSREWARYGRTIRELASYLAREHFGVQAPLREVFGLSTEAMAIALESRAYVVEQETML
jgi:hypothetical protein